MSPFESTQIVWMRLGYKFSLQGPPHMFHDKSKIPRLLNKGLRTELMSYRLARTTLIQRFINRTELAQFTIKIDECDFETKVYGQSHIDLIHDLYNRHTFIQRFTSRTEFAR